MRKKSLALAMALAVALTFISNPSSAQNDSFFSSWEDFDNRDIIGNNIEMPGLPTIHGFTNDQEAPLGTGLLILTALGAGYAVAKRRKE